MSQTDKTSKDSNTKQKGEAELLAQLQKLQQEININLPKTSNTVIGAKRKTDGTTPVPNKKPTFVPRTVTKEEKIISAAPTYNFNNFVSSQQLQQQQLLTDYYVQQQANRFHAQKSSVPTFIDEASSDPNYKGPKRKTVKRKAAGEVWEDSALADWPDNDYRIFVGDLGGEVNDEVLTRAFSQYPSFLKARVVMDKRTGESKGYGFVGFSNAQDYVDALQQMDGKYIGNRPCKLRRSRWKDRNA